MRQRPLDVVLDGLDEVGRHLDPEAGFDSRQEARRLLAERRLGGGFEIEIRERGGQRIEQDAVGDDFAVDEHAVAVADEVIEHGGEKRDVGDTDQFAIIRAFTHTPRDAPANFPDAVAR